MRVVIKNFNMTASEMERRWAEQDNYINFLENQLRQSEEKVKKERQRAQMFRWKVIKKKVELNKKNAEIAKLKDSLAWTPDVLRQKLETVRLDHDYMKPGMEAVKDAGPEKSDGKETESQAVLRVKNSKSTQTVLKSQSSQSTQTESSKKSGRIYTHDEIREASLVMFCSFKAYNLIRKFEPGKYPDPSTVRRHIQGFRCYYGLNDEMFFVLRQKLATLLKADRNVMLVFDEMDIKNMTVWSAHFKEPVIGAKKVMVVMVRGLGSGFKEIVYYDFNCL